MTAPQLSHKLVLEAAQTAADGAGGQTETWAAVGTLWAEVKAGSGRESSGSAGTVSSAAYRITVRGAPVGQSNRPLPGQRFRQGTRLWRILAVTEADALGRYLVCFAQEEVAV